ncbi:MAG: DUF115 domain-containing protein [Treponema sp.]|nr:DUF115 domain-containing protein [Treponema sp.]
MNDKSIYSQFTQAKNGSLIPVLENGKTIESRYNPSRECQKTFELQITDKDHFVIVLGIAGGHLIEKITSERKDIFIIGVETCKEDISFLEQSDVIKKLQDNKNVLLCSKEELEGVLLSKYIPAFYGGIKIIEQQAWAMENAQVVAQLKDIIQKTLSLIAADFSVQSHFGKLWMHNIMSNLLYMEKNNIGPGSMIVPPDKTAVIFAAGPTLDKSIKLILEHPDKYYLIATDTAYSILLSYGLVPDAVVSIDGQYVSNTHFIHSADSCKSGSQTRFIFDISASSSAVKKIDASQNQICFFTSGHPFCSFLQAEYGLKLPYINSGAGTVTICALDYALKCGFSKILVMGADFSYVDGKPYARGTYLDRLYNAASSRISNSTKTFSALEFRTPLINSGDNRFTTTVLQSYRTSFCDFLQSQNIKYVYKDDIYELANNNTKNTFDQVDSKSCSGIVQAVCKRFKELLKTERKIDSINDLTNIDISLLPLISWCRNNDNKDEGFYYYYKKALQYFEKF